LGQLTDCIFQVRAPNDYEANNTAERELLQAVQELHDTLIAKRPHFGQWDSFVQHLEDILATLGNISSVIRRLRHNVESEDVVTQISCFVNALEFHQARLTLVMANASIRQHNSREEVRSMFIFVCFSFSVLIRRFHRL
jgi:Zn-dependent oligopeptidase